MKIDILTLFPEMFKGPFDESIVRRAIDKKLVEIDIHNLRRWTKDKHRTVDDRPFGGGVGMVMMVEPIDLALQDLKSETKTLKLSNSQTLLLSPRGKLFNQKTAQSLSRLQHLTLICGHYEGVDERVVDLVDEEISIGDYVLTGGEIPAMVMVDSITRLLPGVLEKKATEDESFSKLKIDNSKVENLLEYPHYTRPANYKGEIVPEILLSGNHKEIDKWRLKKAFEITKKKRPDLLKDE